MVSMVGKFKQKVELRGPFFCNLDYRNILQCINNVMFVVKFCNISFVPLITPQIIFMQSNPPC